MKRRQFLLGSVALSTLGIASIAHSTKVEEVQRKKDKKHRYFVLTQTYDPIAPEGSDGVTNLWIPLPEDTVFQRVINIEYEGNFKDAYINADNDYGAKTLFATWESAKNSPTLTLRIEVETIDWEIAAQGLLDGYRAPKNITYPKEVLSYLEPTKHMPIDGIVKETANKIIGEETDPLKQARLIYEWVSANMKRDNDVIGCGTGDVKTILESGNLSGKCTDINSVFVALVRAVGIPAREMFGIRVGKSNELDQYSQSAFGGADDKGAAVNTGWQHCRAMFYLTGFGWVPCDPADVTKMRLAENKLHSDPAVQAVNEYLFGNWEMNWIGFNFGRDFMLSPEPEQGSINNFGYPYAEVDGDPLNHYEPKIFSYHYASHES